MKVSRCEPVPVYLRSHDTIGDADQLGPRLSHDMGDPVIHSAGKVAFLGFYGSYPGLQVPWVSCAASDREPV